MEFMIDGFAVQVDDEDAHLLNGRSWRANWSDPKKIYMRWKTRKDGKHHSVYLHRMIVDAKPGDVVDHIDGDSLNCRRSNLRIGDYRLNCRNRVKRSDSMTSRFKGVNWHKKTKKWVAKINYGEKQTHIGYFSDEIHAAFSYDHKSMIHHGDEGRTNFLPFVR